MYDHEENTRFLTLSSPFQISFCSSSLFSVLCLEFFFSATKTKPGADFPYLIGENGHIDRSSARLDFTGL